MLPEGLQWCGWHISHLPRGEVHHILRISNLTPLQSCWLFPEQYLSYSHMLYVPWDWKKQNKSPFFKHTQIKTEQKKCIQINSERNNLNVGLLMCLSTRKYWCKQSVYVSLTWRQQTSMEVATWMRPGFHCEFNLEKSQCYFCRIGQGTGLHDWKGHIKAVPECHQDTQAIVWWMRSLYNAALYIALKAFWFWPLLVPVITGFY